jgi:8-oxo-dGTP pyrophosphatase MutT (NUDIX family)
MSDKRHSDHPEQLREISYGGVVLRGESDNPDLLVITPRGKKALALPKGGADPNESPMDAATREVLEETGAIVEAKEHLGDVQYWYSRGSRRIFKTVRFYLCEYIKDGPNSFDPDEIDEVHWIPLREARQRLSYPGERALMERALAKIG